MQEYRIRRLVVLHVKNGQVTFRMHQMLLVSLLKTIIIVEIQTLKKNPGVIQWIQIYDGNFAPHEMMQKKKIGVHHIMSVWSRILKVQRGFSYPDNVFFQPSKLKIVSGILNIGKIDFVDKNVVTNICVTEFSYAKAS